MSQFKCVYCDLSFRTLCETVGHNITHDRGIESKTLFAW